jgi:transposase
MLLLERSCCVWGYRGAMDLRRGFNGLYATVQRELGRDVCAGDVFLFVSRSRRGAKILWHDGTGLCLLAKRLDTGRFAALWRGSDPRAMDMTLAELALYVGGATLVGVQKLERKPIK